MKVINVDNVAELQCSATDYWSIINFFKNFSADWYNEHNIYFEQHHIYPKSEVGADFPITVNLPYKYHFLAHYYRAVESTWEKAKFLNFNACQVMIGKNKNVEYIKKNFPNEFYQMKAYIINHPNNCKPVINLETKQIYKSIKDLEREIKLDRHYIRKICTHPERYYANSCYKTKYFAFYDESLPMEYYEKLYSEYRNIPKRKKKAWSDEALKARAIKVTGQKFTQSKSKKVVDLYTGSIYDSTTQAEDITGVDRHKILKSCREKREIFLRKGKCNFRYEDEFDGTLSSNESLNNFEKDFLKKCKGLPTNKTENSKLVTVDGEFFNSVLQMSKLTGMSRTTIMNHMGKLVNIITTVGG